MNTSSIQNSPALPAALLSAGPPGLPPIPPHFTADLYPGFLTRQIGFALRTRREGLGLSAYALAKTARVTDQTILNIEQGATSPNLVTVALICVRFGLSVSEFVGGAEREAVCPKSLG